MCRPGAHEKACPRKLADEEWRQERGGGPRDAGVRGETPDMQPALGAKEAASSSRRKPAERAVGKKGRRPSQVLKRTEQGQGPGPGVHACASLSV